MTSNSPFPHTCWIGLPQFDFQSTLQQDFLLEGDELIMPLSYASYLTIVLGISCLLLEQWRQDDEI